MPTRTVAGPADQPTRRQSGIPAEIEIYVESDGTVTFADLAEDMLCVAKRLNPDSPLACHIVGMNKDHYEPR